MTFSVFNILVAAFGTAVAASSVWGAIRIVQAYKTLRGSEGAFLLAQARSTRKANSGNKGAGLALEPTGLSSKLAQAGIPLSASQWIGIQVLICIAVGSMLLLVGLPNSTAEGIGAIALILALVVAGTALGFRQLLQTRARNQVLLLEKQLAQIELQIAENSRSGLPISRSILACSELTEEPLRSHLQRLHNELTYSNLTLADGFENIARRTGSSDAHLLASVISVQQQTGSNLADALGFLHETISRRLEMRQTLRSSLAETRITRNIVAVTPWALFLMLAFAPFLKIDGFWEFYSQNPLGHVVLGACIAAEIGILFLISRLSDFKFE